MARANWLSRMLFENNESAEVSDERIEAFLDQSNQVSVPEVVVNVETSTLEGLIDIDTMYEKAGLQNLEKSIFKVDEFGKILPDSLPSDVKRQSVIGILTTSGLQIDALKSDADQRIGSINSVMEQFTNQTVDILNVSQNEISELELRIDELKRTITDRKALQEKQEKIADDEIEKISGIVKFLG
ncbi:hypothetical protein D3C81_634410 [compost metagenome]